MNLGPLRFLFAAIFLGVGYFVGQHFGREIGPLPATSDPVRRAVSWVLPVYVVVFEAGLLCVVAWILRAATIFRDDVIQVRGLLRQRRAARADIAGYKIFGGENAFLELHLRRGKKFRAYLHPAYSGRKKLEYVDAWLEGLPNLGAIEAEKLRLELDQRGLLDQRARELDRFERSVKRADIIGNALLFTLFLLQGANVWKPLEPMWRAAEWVLLAAPCVSLALTARARRLYSARDVRVYAGYPGYALTVMGGIAGALTLIGLWSGFEVIAGPLRADAVTLAAAAVGAAFAPAVWLALRPARQMPLACGVIFVSLTLWGAGLGVQLAAVARQFGLVSAI